MKEQNNRIKVNKVLFSILALIVLAGATTGILTLGRNHTDAAASVKPTVGVSVPSMFSFSGSTGWFQGATNKTSMALFHKYDCFT